MDVAKDTIRRIQHEFGQPPVIRRCQADKNVYS